MKVSILPPVFLISDLDFDRSSSNPFSILSSSPAPPTVPNFFPVEDIASFAPGFPGTLPVASITEATATLSPLSRRSTTHERTARDTKRGMPLALWTYAYPSATSSTIIIVNPIMTPIVAISPFLPLWASGINSSTTTKIIAPAANASA